MVVEELTAADKSPSKATLTMKFLSNEDSNEGHQEDYADIVSSIPSIIPCFYGKELTIDQELINAGFAGIAIKHNKVFSPSSISISEIARELGSLSGASEQTVHLKIIDADVQSKSTLAASQAETVMAKEEEEQQEETEEDIDDSVSGFPGGFLCERNSFWDVHRPELTKLKWEISPTQHQVEEYLKAHALFKGADCSLLCSTDADGSNTDHLKVIHPPSPQDSYEDFQNFNISGERSINISDEDLSPANTVHRSAALFCFTIGQVRTSHRRNPSGEVILTDLEKIPPSDEHGKNKDETNLTSSLTEVDQEQLTNIIMTDKPIHEGNSCQQEMTSHPTVNEEQSLKILLQPRNINNLEGSSRSELEMNNIVPRKKLSH